MKQCDTCLNYEALPHGCAVIVGEEPADDTPKRYYCLCFNDDDGPIPVEYWEDKEKCPYFMQK